MPRTSSDYSAKHTLSPEVKSISAKRLYRGVMDCVKKLDAGRQHRRNLISLFQAEQVKLRHKLREACEKLMFTYPSEYGRKAEELLWRKVYYDVIHAVKSGRKFQSNAPGALQQRHLEPHYRQFLYSAIGFYHYLLLRLQSKVKVGLVCIDFPLASQAFSRSSSLIGDGYQGHKNYQDEEEKELEEWVKSTSYRLLVCLGDLSRYQMEFGVTKTRAIRYYQLALLARPNAGMPHNQLATVAGHHSWWGLSAAYHYCRALHAEIGYEGAEVNLQKLLDRNKKLFYQLPTDALDGVITAQVYRKEHTRIFIVSFLYLCDLLRPKTYATDVETTGLCKRLIDALHVCLSHMNNEHIDDDYSITEDASIQAPDTVVPRNQHKSDSKRYGLRTSLGSNKSTQVKISTSLSHHHHSHQQKLNGDIVFKICVLCLVNVHDLQTCRSNRSSAAIAFILAFFSHLLGYLIQQLSRPAEIMNGTNEDKKNAAGVSLTKADGDGKMVKSKNKKSKSRMRRRRRGVNVDDLSEGEEDVMGGGDAATDSDLSDSESEDVSESLSDSSGSGNRLSQENLSSQEDDTDVNENDYSASKNQVTEKETKPHVIDASQSTLAVASLQDLSNKMFQPSTRRKITLAPSFMQNLTPPSPKPNLLQRNMKEAKAESEVKKDVESAQISKEKNEIRAADEDKKQTENDDAAEKEESSPGDNLTEEKQREIELKKESKAFDHLLALSRHHHVMAAVKLLSDWLASNERVAAACAKNSRALWSRLVCLINLLSTEREMLNRDEVRNDPVCFIQVKRVLDALEKGEEERKAKEEAEEKEREEASLKEAASQEKKIKIEKRKTTAENQAKKPPPWIVTTALPEDHTVHMMRAVKDNVAKTGVDLSKPYAELSNIQQCVIRTCRLRHLCRSLSSIDGVEIDVIGKTELGNERFSAPEEEAVDPQMELEAVEAMRKARLMKDMAASRLRNEVQALETSLGTGKSRDSALCLYLVPDTSALCYELTHVRRLVASERFFVVIPKTVIDGLDGLKKELQGARDAIRYLETEFKKANRFIRAQSSEELMRVTSGEKAKTRRQDKDAWRFQQIVECCRILMQKEAKKTNTGVGEHSGLVTILRHEKEERSEQLKSAIASAKTHGIQIMSAATFTKSWSQQNAS